MDGDSPFMATAKPSRTRKPVDSTSKVTRAKNRLTANAASTSRSQEERQQAALKQAKLEAKAKAEYEKAYRLTTVQMAKQQARMDARRDAMNAAGATGAKKPLAPAPKSGRKPTNSKSAKKR